jgi:aspartyl-tRNA(Asn)/glutamyl-tRNA(Gln) amidotransferase subunit A
MSFDALLKLGLAEVSSSLSKREISSLELTQYMLARINKTDDALGAYLIVDEQGALKAASDSDERRRNNAPLGGLDGVPVALKDMILTKGLKTTAASRMLENYIPPYEATVSQRLKDAGAIVLGKLNQDEFAMGSSNESSAFKICRNPWDLTRTPGGSSGGSAACVAGALAFGTLGTDTGGSIRQPASYCGITGLKPTYGRVSRFGVVAFASSLDQVGPMTKDVRGCAEMLQAISGHDERDSTSVKVPVDDYVGKLNGQIKGLRIGVPREFDVGGLDEEVSQNVQNAVRALKELGATIVDISLPSTPHAVATYYVLSCAEASSNLSRYDGVRFGPRLGANVGLRAMYEQTRGELFGPEVKRRILLGTYVLNAGYYDAYYVRAQKVRRLFRNDFDQAFTSVDAIICPTAPTTAFKLGEKTADPLKMYLNDIFTISANLAGLPALSLCSGVSKEGLPIGTQLIGKPFEESVVLNIAYALEQTLKVENVSPFALRAHT